MDIFWRHNKQRGKNDYVFHNTCLDYVVYYYDGERERDGREKILINILHTDNCAGQYKCRQNLLKLTTFTDRRPGTYAQHRFAQKFKFKGPWDATGKIVKEAIKNCELQFKRCATAMDCYENMTERLANDGNGKEQRKWETWETEKDKQILTKTIFKTNRTFIGLAVETKQKYDELVGLGKNTLFLLTEDLN